MDIREEIAQHWKVGLAIAVLVIVNVLTFTAQETALERERETVASLARQLNDFSGRESRLLVANEAQSTRIAQLEATLRAGTRVASATAFSPSTRSGNPTTVSGLAPASATPTPSPTAVPPTVTPTTAPSPTASPSPGATAAVPSPGTAATVRYISTPGRQGVYIRLECSARSATAGIWLDGTRVVVLDALSSCPGWLRVQSADGQTGWVAAQLLSEAPPR